MAFKLFLGKKKHLVFFLSESGKKKSKIESVSGGKLFPGKKNTVPLMGKDFFFHACSLKILENITYRKDSRISTKIGQNRAVGSLRVLQAQSAVEC